MVLPKWLSRRSQPIGVGDVAKNAAPSNEDIGRVAAGALADPDRHAGKRYRPTGPALISPDAIASAMGRALGRSVRYMDISEAMMTRALKVNPPGNYAEALVAQLALYAEEYRRGTFAVNAPTDHVAEVTRRRYGARCRGARTCAPDWPGACAPWGLLRGCSPCGP